MIFIDESRSINKKALNGFIEMVLGNNYFYSFSSCKVKDLELMRESEKGEVPKDFSLGKVIYGVDDRYDVVDYPIKVFPETLSFCSRANIKRLSRKERRCFSF